MPARVGFLDCLTRRFPDIPVASVTHFADVPPFLITSSEQGMFVIDTSYRGLAPAERRHKEALVPAPHYAGYSLAQHNAIRPIPSRQRFYAAPTPSPKCTFLLPTAPPTRLNIPQ